MSPSTDLLAFRRTLATGTAARFFLVLAAMAGTAIYVFPLGNPTLGAALFAAAALVYFYLSWKSIAVSRDAMPAHEHLARGNLPEAEQLLTTALRKFSLFPSQRAVELLQLAQLRFEQSRYIESADLANAVLSLRSPAPILASAQLVRLEAVTELLDLPRVHAGLLALAKLPLSHADSARLMYCRTLYEVALSAHDHTLYLLPGKLQLAQALSGPRYARWCLELARSALAAGRHELFDHLVARAVAVGDSANLARKVPDLADAVDKAALHPEFGRI